MNFNENQLFYASLWWVNALPGGSAVLQEICDKYEKPVITFPEYEPKRKPRQWNGLSRKEQDDFIERNNIRSENTDDPDVPEKLSDESKDFLNKLVRSINIAGSAIRAFNDAAIGEMNEHLPAKTLHTFFDTLYECITAKNKFEDHYNDEITPKTHIRLRQECVTSADYFPFSDEIEAAIMIADIDRGILPQNTCLHAHADGQLFVPQKDGERAKLVSIDYPGKPGLPYRHLELKSKDFVNARTLTWETLYRVVPLEEGETYKHGWITVAGDRYEIESSATANEVMIVGNNDVDDIDLLSTLTDEEIKSFDPRLRGALHRKANQCNPGYVDDIYESEPIEATNDPRMIRSLIKGVKYMIATEAVQFGSGQSFQIAEPGDYIIVEKEGYHPRVIAKKLVDSGRVRFIFDNGTLPAAPSRNSAGTPDFH